MTSDEDNIRVEESVDLPAEQDLVSADLWEPGVRVTATKPASDEEEAQPRKPRKWKNAPCVADQRNRYPASVRSGPLRAISFKLPVSGECVEYDNFMQRAHGDSATVDVKHSRQEFFDGHFYRVVDYVELEFEQI